MASVKSIIFGALASLGLASASNAQQFSGVTYGNSVEAITYDNLGCSGSYQDVTGYDPTACTCTYSSTPFSGPLAPLNEGLSLHFRGPLYLKQFGVYYPKTKSKRHIHQHLGRRHHAHHKKAVDDCDEDSSSPGADNSNSGTWEQSAYYNADQQFANGLVFLNNNGGDGSGTFDFCGGSSLSYMSPDSTKGSKNPQTLHNAPIGTCDEFVIFSDQLCSVETCGYYRSDIPAYQGFAGDKKIFVFEFSMPHNATGAPLNDDMPAIWALNSKIPRTFQYGIGDGVKFPHQSCSCWESGCGELDLFEILEGNKANLISHYHSEQGTNNQYGGGGSADYFTRPCDNSVKAAVIFDGNKEVIIRFLPDSTAFTKEMVDEDFMDLKDCSASVYTLPS